MVRALMGHIRMGYTAPYVIVIALDDTMLMLTKVTIQFLATSTSIDPQLTLKYLGMGQNWSTAIIRLLIFVNIKHRVKIYIPIGFHPSPIHI